MEGNSLTTIIVTTCATIICMAARVFFNHVSNYRQMKAETKKTEAETQKLVEEARKIAHETQQPSGIKSNTDFSTSILYDGKNPDYFDFETIGIENWDSVQGKLVGEKVGGAFKIKDDVLIIDRTDNEGRYRLTLRKYQIQDTIMEYVPQDFKIGVNRKIQISCWAKSQYGKRHTLDFSLREYPSGHTIKSSAHVIVSKEWMELIIPLIVPNDKDFILQIYNKQIETPPSSLQIKKLRLIERYYDSAI